MLRLGLARLREVVLRPQPVDEILEEHLVRLALRGGLRGCRGLGGLAPVVWGGDEAEVAGRTRVVDLDRLDHDAEELGADVRALVEPVECLAMLVPELGSDPDGDRDIVARRVGQEFAEVVVVGRPQLVLDDHRPVAPEVVDEQVQGERPDGRLLEPQFEVQAQRLAEDRDVLGQPGGEVLHGLVRPEESQVNPLEDAELLRRHPALRLQSYCPTFPLPQF